MTELLGISPVGFLIVTVVLFGFCAVMTGQALANGWNKPWKLLPYSALLAAGNRFISYALAGGVLESPSGFLVSWAVLLLIAYVAFRYIRACNMVSQYPWLYEMAGFFSWKARE